MPFLNADGRPLRVIDLRQTPAAGHYFQLVRAIGFREHDAPEDADSNPTFWAPAHHPSDDPKPGNRTDLASVPWIFWSFIASYGRQSAPAILHDHLSEVAGTLPRREALRERRRDDRLFRVGLRQQKVPLLRAWLMWTFVSFERYFALAKWTFALLAAQTALGVALVYFAVVAGVGNPLWLLLLAAPVVASLAWGPDASIVIWGTFSIAVLAPLMVLQVLAVVPFWLLEVVVRELIDRPFVDHHPDTQVGPFFRESR